MAKLNFWLKVVYYIKPLLKFLAHKDGLLKSYFKSPARFYTMWFTRIRARKFKKLDIPPFFADFMTHDWFLCHYKFILCIIAFCINESTACVNLACKVIFEFPPLDCAWTKMSKTLQSYKTYSIFLHHLLKTCFKQDVFMRKNFKQWLFIASDLK